MFTIEQNNHYREGDGREENEHEDDRDAHEHHRCERNWWHVRLGLLDIGHNRLDVRLCLSGVRLGLHNHERTGSVYRSLKTSGMVVLTARAAATMVAAAAGAGAGAGAGTTSTKNAQVGSELNMIQRSVAPLPRHPSRWR